MQTASSPLQAETPAVGVPETDFTPVAMREIELGQALPTLLAFDEQKNRTYRKARYLVRLHTYPLGLIDLAFEEDTLSPQMYAPLLWQALGEQINAHLRADGLPEITTIDDSGVSSTSTPRCLAERAAFLQRAPRASVVISTRNRPDRLARCLKALLAMEYPDYEIIVVDNAPSNEATADFIRQTYASEPRIHYAREDRPGLSAGRNRGIKEAQGKFVAITDDDVVVDTHWLAELVQGFEAAENVACTTSLLLPLELETPTQAMFEEFGGFTKGFSRRIFDHKSGQGIPFYPFTAGRFGTGGGFALSAAFLQKEGHFDLALGNGTPTGGGEDLATFFQVIERKYRLVYQPGSLVYHEHHRDYAKLRKQMYCYGSALTAYLTKIVVDNPLLIFKILPLIPPGLFFILNSRSEKNQKKSHLFSPELTNLERKGMLKGPFAYLKSRREVRRTTIRLTRASETRS